MANDICSFSFSDSYKLEKAIEALNNTLNKANNDIENIVECLTNVKLYIDDILSYLEHKLTDVNNAYKSIDADRSFYNRLPESSKREVDMEKKESELQYRKAKISQQEAIIKPYLEKYTALSKKYALYLQTAENCKRDISYFSSQCKLKGELLETSIHCARSAIEEFNRVKLYYEDSGYNDVITPIIE